MLGGEWALTGGFVAILTLHVNLFAFVGDERIRCVPRSDLRSAGLGQHLSGEEETGRPAEGLADILRSYGRAGGGQ